MSPVSQKRVTSSSRSPALVKQTLTRNALALFSVILYCASSCLTTLSNKALITVYQFDFPLWIMFFQHLMTAMIFLLLALFRVYQLPKLKLTAVIAWLPVTILFLAMLYTSQKSFEYLHVPAYTVFKNTCTFVITIGDHVFYDNTSSPMVWLAEVVMVIGSLVAGADLGANASKGYAWMTANILVTAMYVLYLKQVQKSTSFTRMETVFCNNTIAMPFVGWLLVMQGRTALTELSQFDGYSPTFLLLLFLNCIAGFLLNFSCFWTIQQTSPTTYTIMGTFNKIPLTILGVVLFHVTLSNTQIVSLLIGMSGTILYAWTRYKENKLNTPPPLLPVFEKKNDE